MFTFVTLLFAVTLPDGVYSGQTIHVKAPNGQLNEIIVPDGFGPGSTFTVEFADDPGMHSNNEKFKQQQQQQQYTSTSAYATPTTTSNSTNYPTADTSRVQNNNNNNNHNNRAEYDDGFASGFQNPNFVPGPVPASAPTYASASISNDRNNNNNSYPMATSGAQPVY